MNGAEALVRTLAAGDIDVCFSNPGTSEMHFVAALDRAPGMRCVLCLFEGGASGAADGYARMADKPAATLLHLGTGLTNSLANLHNARKARTPVVNIVGEHAVVHQQYDGPLQSDTRALAAPMSHWLKTAERAEEVGPAAAEAIIAAQSAGGQIASLIITADASWNEGGAIGNPASPPALRRVPADEITAAAKALQSGDALLLVGGMALRAEPTEWAAAIAATTGAAVFTQARDARVERGAGRVSLDRLPNATGPAVKALENFRTIVMVGAQPPVANFAHPGQPSLWAHPDCAMIALAGDGDDLAAALRDLAAEVGAKPDPARHAVLKRPALPTGTVTPEALAQALAAMLPENAIVVDEAVTTGRTFFAATKNAPRHDYLALTGGAIGWGLAASAGAAIACPDRKVIGLQADGSGLYTAQSLWTHAREKLDILTVVFANREYAILRNELKNVGISEAGHNAITMLTLDNPPIDWVSLAKGFGVPGRKVTTMDEFNAAFAEGLTQRGPALIEVVFKAVVT